MPKKVKKQKTATQDKKYCDLLRVARLEFAKNHKEKVQRMNKLVASLQAENSNLKYQINKLKAELATNKMRLESVSRKWYNIFG